jgi:hypothetical protein
MVTKPGIRADVAATPYFFTQSARTWRDFLNTPASFFAERLVVHREDTLRELHYGSGATDAIAEIEADHRRPVGVAVEVE